MRRRFLSQRLLVLSALLVVLAGGVYFQLSLQPCQAIAGCFWHGLAWAAGGLTDAGRQGLQGGLVLLLVLGAVLMAWLFERELASRQATTARLRDAEAQLATILSHLPSAISYWDRDLRNRFANPMHQTWFGLQPEKLKGRSLAAVVGDALFAAHQPLLARALAGEPQAFDLPLPREGALTHLQVSLTPDLQAGQVEGLLVQIMDITERKRGEDALFEEKERFRVTLGSIGDGVLTVDVAGRVTYLNPVGEVMTGWRNDEARGLPVETVLPLLNTADGSTPPSPIRVALARQSVVALASGCALVRRDGQRFDIEDSAAAINDRHGQLIGAVMVFHDISEMRSMAIRMAHLAQHDALTSLPNRVLLHERAEQLIAESARDRKQVAVLYLDLDRFKTVNDSLGHEAGDLLLVEVSRRLATAVRRRDTLSRQGGDEFVILQPGLDSPAQAGQLAQKLMRLCAAPFNIDGHELNVTITVGISLFPGDGRTFDELAKHADAALYAAKHAGRNRFHFYTQALGQAAHDRLLLEQALKSALEHQEIHVEYQPKVDFASGAMVGVEALVRWRHGGRTIPPYQFIPLAEESGQIVDIGRFVLRQACRDAMRVVAGGRTPVAVNVSIRQLGDPGFISDVRHALRDSGLPACELEIEVTESVLMQNMAAVTEVLGQLKGLGVRIAIDDFGTGYSSLAYLSRLPVDVIKIDKSFVDAYAESRKNQAVITAIIDLAEHLSMAVIAEGVEQRHQADFLVSNGCHCMQGYYFSRPLPLLALQSYAGLPLPA